MKNSNGGILGVAVTPNSEAPDAVQSGIWNMQDVATYEAQGKWAQPNVGPDASPITSDPTTITVPQNTTDSITFSGALDSEDSNIVDYEIISISESYLTITTTNPVLNTTSAAFTFSAGTVTQDETVNFTVKVTDAFGLTDTKSFTMTVQANTIPVASTLSMSGTSTFAQNSSTVLTFTGATDAEDSNSTLQHEIINISPSAAITSVSPSSDSSSPFTFTLNSGSVSTVTTVTFDVKVTDSAGASSSKQFSVTVLAEITRTLGSHSANSGWAWHSSRSSYTTTYGTINVPSGMTLDYFYIKGATGTTAMAYGYSQGVQNVYPNIDWIQVGGTTVYGGNLTELSTTGDGTYFETNHSIASGNQAVTIRVGTSSSYYETSILIYIASSKWVFS